MEETDMRIGRIVAIGAGGALAVVGVRKLRQARAGRQDRAPVRDRSTSPESSSRLGPVTPQRPLDPEPARRVDEEQADGVLRPVPESA
jgi:hypothetical protein